MIREYIIIGREFIVGRQPGGDASASFILGLVSLLLLPYFTLLIDHHAVGLMPDHGHIFLGEPVANHAHLLLAAQHHDGGVLENASGEGGTLSVVTWPGKLIFTLTLQPELSIVPSLSPRFVRLPAGFVGDLSSFWPLVPTRPPRD